MKKLTQKDVLSIVQKRNAGKTNEEIGVDLGVSRAVVSYWVHRLRDSGHEIKRFGRGGRKGMKI